MKHHPSMTRQDVVNLGPSKIAKAIAHEFCRASDRAEFQEMAISHYHRARELMGILETIDLSETVALKLLPFYRLCSYREIFKEERLHPFFVKHFSNFVSQAFKEAAHSMDPRQGRSGMTAENHA